MIACVLSSLLMRFGFVNLKGSLIFPWLLRIAKHGAILVSLLVFPRFP